MHLGDQGTSALASRHNLAPNASESDILRCIAHPLSKATSKEDNGQLNGSHSQSNSSNNSDVVDELGLEEAVATILKLLHSWVFATVSGLSSNTAAVRNLTIRESVVPFTGPVSGTLNTTAVQLVLHNVPGVGDPIVLSAVAVVLHPRVHVLHHLSVEVTFQHVSSNAGTNLSNKDDCKEECIGVDQTLALLPCPATAHEGHHEDHATNDHQEDRGVHIVVPQEVQVILGINLGPGSKANENTPSEDEEDVEEDHEVLYKAFATVLHDEAVRIESLVEVNQAIKAL